MKKTLLICTMYPLPESSGGNIRTMHFVRFFQQYGPVDIAYSMVLEGEQAGSGVFAREYPLKPTNKDSLLNRLRRLSSMHRRPLEVSKFEDASEKLLLTAIQENNYDYICVRYIFDTLCLFKVPAPWRQRIIIDYDDISSGATTNLGIARSRGIKKIIYKVNQRFLRRYEEKCLNFGAALFCSEKDQAKLAGAAQSTNTFVVPNIYDNSGFSNHDFGDGFANDNTLLFVGSLSYQPNVQGLKWFFQTIFPFFLDHFPGGRLLLVGRSAHPDIKKLCAGHPNVSLHENVADLETYYQNCRAVIVPLLTGGGTRIKILEAAMAGRPVLSTPKGAEGLALRDDRELLLFANSVEFVGQYEKLLEKEKYSAMVNSSREAVAATYSAARFNGVMERVVELSGTVRPDHRGGKAKGQDTGAPSPRS